MAIIFIQVFIVRLDSFVGMSRLQFPLYFSLPIIALLGSGLSIVVYIFWLVDQQSVAKYLGKKLEQNSEVLVSCYAMFFIVASE